jgi:hypothetical protein
MNTDALKDILSRRFDEIMDILDLPEEDKQETLADAGHEEDYFEGVIDTLLEIMSILRGDQPDFPALIPQNNTHPTHLAPIIRMATRSD